MAFRQLCIHSLRNHPSILVKDGLFILDNKSPLLSETIRIDARGKWILPGLSPMQAIQSATLHSAETLGLQDRAGSIENGKWADLLILGENPLENLRALANPELVIQKGVFVHRNP